MYLPTYQTGYFLEANEMIDHYSHFYNHERIQLKKIGEGAYARPLRFAHISQGAFLCCPHKLDGSPKPCLFSFTQ